MIEFRQLRQFVVVAEELNFGRAAEKLHMSQPPLSVAIRNLELQVGTLLIDRSRHHVRLTPAGKVFLKDAQRLLTQAHAATERARRAAQGAEGSLSLSFVPSAALDLLPDIFKRFQRDYPTVHLHVTAETTTRQVEALRRAEVDLALVVGPLQDVPDLAFVDLQAQGFVIAVPRSHALAKQRSVKIKALAAEPFIAFPAAEGAGFVAALLGACKAAGFSPRVVQEASQMQAVLTLVAGGLGIALVPASMRMLAMKDVTFLEVAETRAPPTYQLAFAYSRTNDNPVIHSFLSVASKVVSHARDT
ncbi:LysR family transcriptional regulator [Variovorax paradoxus]|jgi:DNA-binding transcriptional LysR family regulator|uniref:LysR family transcriptional regulator n=1 Tax=Variovorax paradoxus TaxID=34073 RepID=UPI0029C651A4|nr:LysR family transcriptional regulator [Variovorax paradoxus]WPH23069.1 LysR family transcriptional regulator [Variovorax paradoxus]